MQTLPTDVINHITHFLSIKEIYQFVKTSKNFKQEIHIKWKKIIMRDFKITLKNNNPMIGYQLLCLAQKKNSHFYDFLLQSQLNFGWQDRYGNTVLTIA